MGVLPLQFPDGESARSLGLTGEELFTITGLAETMADGGPPPASVQVTAERAGAEPVRYDARVRIATPREAEYFRHGGILQYVLRQLLPA
jgi:aconitate hydratase